AHRSHRSIVLGPCHPRGNMLATLPTREQEISIGARTIVVLLHELDLELTRVAERERDARRRRGLAAVSPVFRDQVPHDEERAHSECLRPVAERAVEVAHHESQLTHFSEEPAHVFVLPIRRSALAEKVTVTPDAPRPAPLRDEMHGIAAQREAITTCSSA